MIRPFVSHYDRLYAGKDYGKDVADFLTMLAPRDPSAMSLLEIGCGTGNQTLRLAPLFRNLTAVEIDGDFAEALAFKLKRNPQANVRVATRPVETLTGEEHDAAAAFFHVLNYVDVASMPGFLAGVAARLASGAPFVGDLWHAEAVLIDPPRVKEETIESEAGRYDLRLAPTLDPAAETVRLDYRIEYAGAEHRESFREEIVVRLWRKADLARLLAAAGFPRVEFSDYRAYPAPATDKSYRIWMKAERA